MSKPKVFCTENIFAVDAVVEEFLRSEVDLTRVDRRISHDELCDRIKESEGLINMGYSIDKKLLDSGPKLKAVSNISVGYDNFDVEEMKKHGVVGLHTPGVLNESVADLIIGLMISTGRRFCELDGMLREGKFMDMTFESTLGLGITNKKLGIIGMGRIGKTLAEKCVKAFNMKISYCNRNRKPEWEKELNASYVKQEDLLKDSDYVVVITPLTKETYRLIGENEFKLMKKTGIFINASRGSVVDERALVQALRNREIYGAGLDVFEKEPFGKENELITLPNTVLVPHVGSSTAECSFEMAMLAAKGMVEYLHGQTPDNLVKDFL